MFKMGYPLTSFVVRGVSGLIMSWPVSLVLPGWFYFGFGETLVRDLGCI